jgi:hypothetical protein
MSPKKDSAQFSYPSPRTTSRNSSALQSREQPLSGNNGKNRKSWAQPRNWATFLMVMWHRFKNLFFSLKSYEILSPDLAVRRQVKKSLRHRPTLGMSEWFESFCKSRQVAYPVVSFLYTRLETYSGIELGKLLPSDRLEEDLRWTDLCGFDWQTILCDDFMQQFGVDMTHCIEDFSPNTIDDLVLLLHQQFKQRLGYSN